MQRFDGAVLALDVDGVLLNPSPPGRGPWQRVLEQKYGASAADLQSTFFDRLWPEIMIGHSDIEKPLQDALVRLGWHCSAEEFLADWFETDFVLNQDVVIAARSWASAGARLVIVTNQEHRRAAYLSERFSSLLPVSCMAYSAAIHREKRSPEFLAAADRMFGTTSNPSTVVLVDDTVANVIAAARHGWQAILFEGRQDWQHGVEDALASASAAAG